MLAALIAIAFQSPQIQIDDRADEYLRPSLQQYVDQGAKKVEKFLARRFLNHTKLKSCPVVPRSTRYSKIVGAKITPSRGPSAPAFQMRSTFSRRAFGKRRQPNTIQTMPDTSAESSPMN